MPPPKKKRRTEESSKAVASSIAEDASISPKIDLDSSDPRAQNAPQLSNSLFIRGLPTNTTSEDLETHFSQSFPLKHATAILEPNTGNCRGFGFVSFVDNEDAKEVKYKLNGSNFQGSKIKITFAKIRQRGEKISNQRLDAGKVDVRATGYRTSTLVQPSRLIVRNLPWNIKQGEDLASLFRSYGKVKSITIPNKKGGLMSGFAFVTMRGRKNAAKALEGVNGTNLHGRTLAVDWAVDRDQWLALNESNVKQEEKSLGACNGTEGDSYVQEYLDDGTFGELEQSKPGSELQEKATAEADTEDDGASQLSDSMDDKVTVCDQNNESTIFIRNLPFGSMDDDLHEHFEQFGRVRYARVVIDPTTGQSKGTGFVCFRNIDDTKSCLTVAPRVRREDKGKDNKKSDGIPVTSVIQDDSVDVDGRFTMAGRVLHVSQAVGKTEATQLKEKGIELRRHRERDKRHLYLLSEGTITPKSTLYSKLSSSEIAMRESSAKQRKALVDKNPSLHLSMVRLAVRNIPRHITSKDLKTLARDAIVGFATDVKQGIRQPLSKEEIGRAAEEMRQNEKDRKSKGKGLVKQAKIVCESREGGKVREDTGGGRSRGYGFIEYYTHRSALMGLRWLNGHAISPPANKENSQRQSKSSVQERTRRLIVEFAIENAQVVRNRKIRESRPDTKSNGARSSSDPSKADRGNLRNNANNSKGRVAVKTDGSGFNPPMKREAEDDAEQNLVKQQRIIARKRIARRRNKKVV